MLTPTQLKKTLNDCISNMSVEKNRFIRNPNKDFVRNSKCNLETTTKIILGFEDACLGSELKNYFKDRLSELPYKSTFVQQRNKFSDDAFKNLFTDFNQKHPLKKTKYGLFIFAADGTDVNLPTFYSDKKYFVEKCIKNGEGFYQMHINAVYNILEDRFVDIETQSRADFNEGAALNIMVDRAEYSPFSALYIADRNYCCLNVLAHIVYKQQYYLIRCKNIRSKLSSFSKLTLPDDEEFDVEKHLQVIRSTKKCYINKPDQYKCIPNTRVFDYIQPYDDVTTFDLDFRLVSIILPNGNPEYLITNLPKEKFTPQILMDLYKIRWCEETAFFNIKYKCGLSWFHAVKRKFVLQEVYAKLLMYNFTSLLKSCIKPKDKASFKHKHKISFANTAKIARMYIHQKISSKLIKILILMDSPPVRDNRIAPRNVRTRTVPPLNTRI